VSASGFDWDDLRYFLAIARSGRLTVAARRLGQDHATVSRRITALEKDLQSQLFERTPTGYVLTKAGEALLPRAEAIEGAARIFAAGAGDPQNAVVTDVRIGVPDGFGQFFLGRLMGKLRTQHPSVRPEIIEQPQLLSLTRYEADFVLSYVRPKEGRLFTQKVCEVGAGLYAASDYLEAAAPIRGLKSLLRHEFIGYADEYVFTSGAHPLSAIGLSVTPAIRFSSLGAQTSATVGGLGICLLPHFVGRQFPALRPILAKDIDVRRPLWSIVHAGQRNVTTTRACRDFIQAEARGRRALFE
jgi:DNA-binding transcriptional LysR family regulator